MYQRSGTANSSGGPKKGVSHGAASVASFACVVCVCANKRRWGQTGCPQEKNILDVRRVERGGVGGKRRVGEARHMRSIIYLAVGVGERGQRLSARIAKHCSKKRM